MDGAFGRRRKRSFRDGAQIFITLYLLFLIPGGEGRRGGLSGKVHPDSEPSKGSEESLRSNDNKKRNFQHSICVKTIVHIIELTKEWHHRPSTDGAAAS